MTGAQFTHTIAVLANAFGEADGTRYGLRCHQTLYATATDADASGGAGQNPVDTSTYTLDATGQRIATRTAQTTDPATGARTTLTRTLRYAGSGDAPDWTDEGDGTLTRTITGPTGDLTATATFPTASTTDANDVLTWQLSDLHGDISATLPATTTDVLHVSRPDEYGASTDDQPRYAWLGAKQRASDTPGGIILMGVRLYNPATGRFLTPDPIYGGNPNTYTYPVDPINQYDLDGRWGRWRNWGRSSGMGLERSDAEPGLQQDSIATYMRQPPHWDGQYRMAANAPADAA